MKIEDIIKLSGASTVQPSYASHRSSSADLEEMDLSFLELLGTIQNPEAANQSIHLSTEQETLQPLADLLKQQGLRLLNRPNSEKKTEPPAKASSSSKALPVAEDDRQDLNWFRLALQPEELKLLPTMLPPGLPITTAHPLQLFALSESETSSLTARGMAVSKGLAELIEKAYKTGRPVRVDLDQSAAVILRIRQGKVSAEFLSSDPAMVMYLKQQLAELRNRMEAKNLPVGSLSSRQDDPSQGNPKQHSQQSPDEQMSNT